MGKARIPVTAAVRALKNAGVVFGAHFYTYEEHGGTAVSARELGVDEHSVVKTLVMSDETGKPVIVLMHGDMNVSTRELARTMGVKSVTPCDQRTAEKYTGYRFGGTSPFGLRQPLKVYMEETIAGLPLIYINGGKKGFLVSIPPDAVVGMIEPVMVNVGIK